MKYDFTTVLDRKGKDALAVDAPPAQPKEGFDLIPMWVADMNFPVVPSIQESIAQRLAHPTFGYFIPRPAYYDAIIRWQETRNDVVGLEKEHIGFENGVIGGVTNALNVLCSRGDKVLIHSPTYNGFVGSLKNNGYDLIYSPLSYDENGVWRMDFADMEKKIVENRIHAAVFCSPHNPTGRVWERWEIEQAMELFRKHDVMVVSDEIWSDLVRPDCKHIPTQSISEDAKMRTVAMYAPTKTFNLAGLTGSYHIIYNKTIRERCEKEASLSHYNNMNVLSMYALLGAYSDTGSEWVDELNQVIAGNIDYAAEFIKKELPGVSVFRSEGTYMMFINCKEYLETHNKTLQEVVQAGWDVGVCWNSGVSYHGMTHMRINLALPFSRVKEAFDRMKKYVFVD